MREAEDGMRAADHDFKRLPLSPESQISIIIIIIMILSVVDASQPLAGGDRGERNAPASGP